MIIPLPLRASFYVTVLCLLVYRFVVQVVQARALAYVTDMWLMPQHWAVCGHESSAIAGRTLQGIPSADGCGPHPSGIP